KWEDGVSKPFIKSFEYLKSENGPALIAADALKIAEMLAKQGPGAHENFAQAYQYATSTGGLALPRNEAMAFAQKMAAITKSETKEIKIEEPKAVPAKKPSR